MTLTDIALELRIRAERAKRTAREAPPESTRSAGLRGQAAAYLKSAVLLEQAAVDTHTAT